MQSAKEEEIHIGPNTLVRMTWSKSVCVMAFSTGARTGDARVANEQVEARPGQSFRRRGDVGGLRHVHLHDFGASTGKLMGRIGIATTAEHPPSVARVLTGEFESQSAIRPGDQRQRHERQASSMASAVASPPPIHRLAMPRFLPSLRKAPISVTTMRAPEAPIGCPSAHAPPWMLTFSAGRSNSFIAAIVTTANASLIS